MAKLKFLFMDSVLVTISPKTLISKRPPFEEGGSPKYHLFIEGLEKLWLAQTLVMN